MNHHRIASGSPAATAASSAPTAAGGRGRRAFARRAVGLAALALVGACGGGGSADNGGPSLYFPGQGNVFVANVNTADSPFSTRVSLTLTARDPLVSNGSFVDSNLRVTPFTGLSDTYRVTGGYTGDTFTAFVAAAAPPIASTYDARFTNRDTVVLVPSDGSGRPTLTLTRVPEPS